MKISSESFFSKLKSKSKFLDGKEKRLRLREERLIKSESETPRVSVNDFFGINQKTGSPLGKKKLNIKESMDVIQKITKREDGGPVEKGEPYLVGEKGPELMMAKQDVRITPNKDIKYVPPSTSTTPVQTVVRTIIQKQGKKIVNRTRIM